MDITDRVKGINDARNRVVEQQRALLDSINPGDNRTAEQVAQLEQMDAAIVDYDTQVRDLVARDQRETEAAQLREQSAHLFGVDNSRQRAEAEARTFRNWFNADPATRGDYEVDVRAAAIERQMLRQGASMADIRNQLNWDTGSFGSAVPTTMARSLYEYMEASIAAFRLGATQITTASGENWEFPKVAAHGIATQVAGQGTALAGTDPTADKLVLGANKYGQLVLIPSESITDTVFPIESFVGQNIGRAIGRLVDADLVLGTGSITGGIVSSTGLGTVATGGTVASLFASINNLISIVYSINDEYRQNASWLLRDSTAGELRKLRDGAGGTVGAFLWQPSLTNGLINGQPDTFLGYPVHTDPNVAALGSNTNVGAFGDFSTYYLRTVGQVQIDSSTERYFDTDQVGVRGKWRVDGGYIDTNGVVSVRNRAS